MAKSVSSFSLSHHAVVEADGICVPAMGHGYHFDVVFGPTTIGEASSSILTFLREVVERMKVDNPSLNPANVFTQVTVSGNWMERTTYSHGEELSSRLMLYADGWSYQDFTGQVVSFGSLQNAGVLEDA